MYKYCIVASLFIYPSFRLVTAIETVQHIQSSHRHLDEVQAIPATLLRQDDL